MNPYTKIWLIAGLCTSTYLILKFIKTCWDQEPKKTKDPEKVEGNEESKLKKKSVKFRGEKSGELKRRKSEKKSEQDTEAMKIAQPKANFFIALQILDKEIHEKIKKVQEKIIKKNPLLYPALIPISTLHITLAVTHLANETEIKKLKGKLEEWSEKNSKSFMKEPIVLTFDGLSTFNDMVAYVSLKKCENYERLLKLAQAMSDVISSAGFANDNRRFTPHLTILKLSRDYELLRSRKNFKDDFGLMKQNKDYFGKEEVKFIQLLSMNDPKDRNGYYNCYYQTKISESEVEVDHTVCCTPIPHPNKADK